MTVRKSTRSAEETKRLAGKIGRRAEPGDVLCLRGPLGSGKTTFVQGFARGAGFRGSTASPTFGLLRQYSATRGRIYHADFFRLAPKDLPNLGIEEWMGDPRGLCLVEWPDVARGFLPADRLEIDFAHLKNGGRCLTFVSRGPRSTRLLP